MTTEEAQAAWELETGLLNDVDAWIANARFGKKDEYTQAVVASDATATGLMFLIDLVDAQGEIIGNQGYSVGSGWEEDADGMSMKHVKRANVVNTTVFGQLQTRVVKGMKVDMQSRGIPTDAKVWNGLGFHWVQVEHDTVGGKPGSSLMPTEFLGIKEGGAAVVKTAEKKSDAPASDIEKTLGAMAGVMEIQKFQETAITMAGVATNDELMASVLEAGPTGFWATHQG